MFSTVTSTQVDRGRPRCSRGNGDPDPGSNGVAEIQPRDPKVGSGYFGQGADRPTTVYHLAAADEDKGGARPRERAREGHCLHARSDHDLAGPCRQCCPERAWSTVSSGSDDRDPV